MDTFKRNDILAVLGDDQSFWLCKSLQNVKKGDKKKQFRAVWLESHDKVTYTLQTSPNYVPFDSLLCKVRLKASAPGVYQLPPKTKLKLAKEVDVHDEEEEEEKVSSSKRVRKRKDVIEKPCKKKAKVDKPKVDKSNPNWRLKPRPNIEVHEKDPLFETKCEVPFISTAANSHLVRRAINLNDMGLLKKCVNNRLEICNINPPRSVAIKETPLEFAIIKGQKEAIKILNDGLKNDHKKPRVNKPVCHLKETSTGTYNYRSLGIKHIRRLNPSRGGREGNNAFVKDINNNFFSDNHLEVGIKYGISLSTLLSWQKDAHIDSDLVQMAMERGHRQLASEIIHHQMKKLGLGCSFSKFHLESLTKSQKTWDPPIREASAKKAGDHKITPMHTAALNPCTKALMEVYEAYPDIHVADAKGRKPIHFAAVSEGTGTLEFLLSKGAVLDDCTKDGVTPLIMASIAGRVKNIRFIVAKAKAEDDDDDMFVGKFGVGGIDRPQRNSWCALHHAIVEDHLEVADCLLTLGANVDRPLGAHCEKVTPLMLASARGNLPMVKMLITKHKAKVEKTDKLKRTAMTHAAMNGATNVLSYLLHLGASFDKPDSSGNTNLHYACAYGWYFCAKALIDAGAAVDVGNEWKVTPLAISFLKGHTGLAMWLLEFDGVDINAKDDHGRNVIMNMIFEAVDKTKDFLNSDENKKQCPLSEQLLEEVCDLIDRRNADPTLADNKGQNILHYLCSTPIFAPIGSSSTEKRRMIIDKVHKNQMVFLKKFIDYNLDTWKVDDQGDWPVCKALGACASFGRNYPAIEATLEAMLLTNAKVETFKDFSVLQCFAKNFKLAFVDEERKILEKILKIVKSLGNDLSPLVEWRGHNNQRTAFIELCFAYANAPLVTLDNSRDTFLYNFLPELKFDPLSKVYEDKIKNYEKARALLKFFMSEMKPKLSYEVEINDRNSKKRITISAALAILGEENSNEPVDENGLRNGFAMIWKHCMVIDSPDAQGKTPLMNASMANHLNCVINLLDAGADPNATWPDPSRQYKKNEVVHKVLTFPLLYAIELGNMKMTEALLKHGADVQPQATTSTNENTVLPNPFLVAVEKCKIDRQRSRIAVLKMLLAHGADINATFDDHDVKYAQMNALHLAVYESSGRADESLDLEMTLIKSKIDLFAKSFGRYPLHELFRSPKGDKPPTKDPIEACNIMVEAMDGKNINEKDILGKTALHYAAHCGATISCLLLIDKGANIHLKDENENTALAYSVLGGHDACALMLMQKGADVNVTIKKDTSKVIKAKVSSHFKFLPRHFKPRKEEERVPLFQALIENDWLGLTFVALREMERCNMTYAAAIEVAFRVKKFQFAKRLIEKQVSEKKLQQLVSSGRNLMVSLAFECIDSSTDSILLQDILLYLLDNGLSINHQDDFGCTVFHYACLNRNVTLLKIICDLQSKDDPIHDRKDKQGRNPLMSLLWKKSGMLMETAKHLLELGNVSVNIRACMKPLSHLNGGFTNDSNHLEFTDKASHEVEYTPLILAVVHRNMKLMECLFEAGAEVDFSDSNGWTPLMHAVKMNDIKIVRQLLQRGPDLLLNDKTGKNVFMHALKVDEPNEQASVTFDNVDILESLLRLESRLTREDFADLYQAAIKAKAIKIAQKLATRVSSAKPSSEIEMFSEVSKAPSTFGIQKFDCSDDAQKMLRILENQLPFQEQDSDEPKPPSGCQVNDGILFNNRNAVMTKVDVSSGAWGMYNFYRMQLWKEKHKDLYILFTNWGRIGESFHGQYQNTPFGSEEQAIQEFDKIFKAKTGNEWASASFHKKSKKYRLVQSEVMKKVKKKDIVFDLKSNIPSRLPGSITALMKDISNVSMYIDAYKAIGVDYNAVPFGRIKKENIAKASEILDQLQRHAKKKENLTEKRDRVDILDKEKLMAANEELHVVVEQIANLSTEYYYLMPRSGFEFTSLRPLDNDAYINEEQERIKQMTEFAIAERFLLGAQFRKNEINPLDYIYSALNCNIQALASETDDEAVPHILRYIYQSRGASNADVLNIYKVFIQKDEAKPTISQNSTKHSRQLLWHGTKAENLMSILNRGLLIKVPFVEQSGSLFGDGIYLANVFDKSQNYAPSGFHQSFGYGRKRKYRGGLGGQDGSSAIKYLLLCDAALGKSKRVTEYIDQDDLKKQKIESVHGVGQNTPDPRGTVRLCKSGLQIPSGSIVPSKAGNNSYLHLSYDEFVVYDSNQVAVRYIVRLRN